MLSGFRNARRAQHRPPGSRTQEIFLTLLRFLLSALFFQGFARGLLGFFFLVFAFAHKSLLMFEVVEVTHAAKFYVLSAVVSNIF